MVLGATLAGGAAVGSWLWGYNRENFKFDREMRQKNEFKILEFRNVQAQLWREDIRDIISLTEKKMDSYLIISVLQLEACVGLFTEGRLEPGTPPWLLHFYMMTLGAAFMYLLMSVWFAMHASVVAQCSSVRLLTQFVRLPVPTWEEIEHMRTYASAYESVHPGHWLRVPFTKSLAPAGSGYFRPGPGTPAGGGTPVAASTTPQPPPACSPAAGSEDKQEGARQPPPPHADPWGLEAHGMHRNLYELQEQPATLRRHVALARRAAAQYQCFDAFARVSMTFGTNQLLNALAYYSLGYVAVQDGASWPAWSVVITMASIAMTMVHVDFSLTRCEQYTSQALIFIALAAGSVATFIFSIKGPRAEHLLPYVLPVAYAAHGLWLLLALRSCGITEQDNGALLPMKFRAVLYLDVFGWLHKDEAREVELQDQKSRKKGSRSVRIEPEAERRSNVDDSWSADDFSPGSPAAGLRVGPPGPSGQIHDAPDHAFQPASYAPPQQGAGGKDFPNEDIVTGHARMQPSRLAASVFRAATWLVILLWFCGMWLPLLVFTDNISKPLITDIFFEDMEHEVARGEGGGMHAMVGTDPSGMPELMPVIDNPEELPPLAENGGELIQVVWPDHASFIPRALSSNALGTGLVVADDFNVYAGQLTEPHAQTAGGGLRGAQPAVSMPTVSFEPVRSCAALEGQSFRDIAVICDRRLPKMCRLLVLTSHGTRLTECPLPVPLRREAPISGSPRHVMQPNHTWSLSQDWLHADASETVESIALNDDCITPWTKAQNLTGHVFFPKETGCTIVGTSSGRIVQLREAHADADLLIPERIMHQRNHPSSRGSLVILKGRFLMSLWWKCSSLSAFDAQTGALVKEWHLPRHIHWLMLTSGGNSIFLLGVRNERHVELYRFPTPLELQVKEHVETERDEI